MIDVIVFITGAVIGSFLNVVGLRLLREESFVLPPSHCYSCDTPLKPYDNIPILSWLILKGKCRSCKVPISKQYPVIEALTGILFVALSHQYGYTLQTCFLLLLICNFMVILITDFREQYIFDINSIGLIPIGLIYSWLNLGHVEGHIVPFGGFLLQPSFISALYAIGGSFILFLCLNLYSKWIAGSEGFGEGDNRLMMGIGAFFGLGWMLITFILGFMVQALFGIPMMLFQWFRHKAYRALMLMTVALFAALVPYWLQNMLPRSWMILAIAGVCGGIALWSSIKAIRHAKTFDIPFTYIPFGPALVFACIAMLFYKDQIIPYFRGFIPL